MIVYLNGEYGDEKEAYVLTQDRAFVFGDGVYEAFRIYNNKIFKLVEHKKRFQRSLNELKIDFKINTEIEDIFENLSKMNKYKNKEQFLYIQISRGLSKRTHHFSHLKVDIGIYAFLVEKEIDLNAYINGISVCTTEDIRWARCDIKCISLVANCLANDYAKEKGYEESLFVLNDLITEGTHTNVCFIKDNILYTHPKTNRILSGITRELVLALCKKNNIKVIENAINIKKLNEIDEAFLLGTVGEITPIIKINDISLSFSKPGPITKKLQKLFRIETKK
ncbi:MAG: aminotransferase class IV [Campylobacteraceae bacterium]|nr:aminotransferase class IV [Campylobacteraceae bacterium]